MDTETEHPFSSEEDRYEILDEIFSRNSAIVRDVQDEYDQAQKFYQSQEQQQNDLQQPQDLSTPINLVRRDKNKGRPEVTALSGSTTTSDTAAHDPAPTTNTQASPPTKKKKKKKSKSANLPEAGTALPDDYQEKYKDDVIEDPFEPSRPLARRVEYAIWKYRRNHKFTQENKAIFDHYLKFGGVDTSPNAFLGRTTSADTPDDPDAEADFEAAKTATDAIDLNDTDDENEDGSYISFSEVVQIYLGKVFVHSARFISLQDYISAPVLIDSFLRYLQIRNVCPEYSEDLTQARLFTAQAKEELPRCKRVSNLLPGDFNMALGILFGGEVGSGTIGDGNDGSRSKKTDSAGSKQEDGVFPDFEAWAAGDSKMMALMSSFLNDVVGMNSTEARRIAGSMISDIDAEKAVETHDRILVKIKHIMASPCCNGTESVNLLASTSTINLVKVSVVAYDEDSEKMSDDAVFDLYFEKEIADEFLVGMVMNASMRRLTSGLWYLVRGYLVCPSFYKKDEFADDDD